MRPDLPDTDVSQYLDVMERLRKLELAVTPEAARLVGATGQPAFQNSWTNFDSTRVARFYRHLGRVYLAGLIKGGTVPSVAWALPSEYLPDIGASSRAIFPSVSNDAFSVVTIESDGGVRVANGSNVYVSLDGINFRHK